MKGDPMDLRLDIERRKKYCSHEIHCNHDHERDAGNSQACSREKSVEKLSKCHERSKYVNLSRFLYCSRKCKHAVVSLIFSERPYLLDMKDFASVVSLLFQTK